ncbi:dTMP kinase [Henriciella sp.]|uniref:dTMP kinase n=1 Tax=Henriciella sp. TaxID=1968823 RepID=UPI0026244523|nr:dTMP kinase [Henriciella sp.]
MARGRFITIEGGEGCGKSTLLRGIAEKLKTAGIPAIMTREPGGTRLAEAARQLVLSPPDQQAWSPLGEALLMNAARSDHVDRLIEPTLQAGEWVLCDRFIDSTRVYQGLSGVSGALLQTLHDEITRHTQPDLTIVLDAPAEALISRRSSRGTSDVFESRPIEFHKQVRQAFLSIAEREPERCIVIDAQQPPSSLVSQALDVIHRKLVPA